MAVALPAFNPVPHRDPATTKRELESLLRARSLRPDGPPLRGEDRRLQPLPTRIAAVDGLLGGGFPRGRLSEVHGPVSSGRTSVLLALLAAVTSSGALAALVDPLDCLDPASAALAGTDLSRLLWLRGPRTAGEEPAPRTLAEASAAVATVAGSGLFDLVVLDVAGVERVRRSLPETTWVRLQRLVEGTPTALVLVSGVHVACGPGGAQLALEPQGPRWSGVPGPARLLAGLVTHVRTGRHGLRTTEIALTAPA